VASSLQPRPLRVLLAEDDREMRRLLVSTLRKARCEVIEAGSGVQLSEAISRAGFETDPELSIDLIVSDVHMPGKSGLEVLSGLRLSADETPVILITAFGDNETHAEAYRLGALAVFNKPFELDELRSVVVALRDAREDVASGVQAVAEASLHSTK
jgi:DNA-binding response OmpR family regulator